jgi:sn-glycerol 3-phosphate transport system ATP-binding protein
MAIRATEIGKETINAGSGGLRLRGISRNFDASIALDDVSIDLPAGQFSVLLGPSGCGKSTLLRLISGLDLPSSGRIYLGDVDITKAPPARRDIAMVFQSYALFPHLNVAQNILFGLSVRRVAKAEQHDRLQHVASMMGLTELLGRRPAQLSGGQQQRVALARAVISDRAICLMDEPLSNLDAKLRAEMRDEIRALQRRLGLTMVYVTHDQIEAMTMADRIVVMDKGRVQQVAPPRGLYERPANTFVARFIGTPPMSLIPVEVLAGTTLSGPGDIIGIRPEDIVFDPNGVPARLAGVEYLGADQLAAFDIGPTNAPVRVVMRLCARETLIQETLSIAWPKNAVHRFDAEGRRISSN